MPFGRVELVVRLGTRTHRMTSSQATTLNTVLLILNSTKATEIPGILRSLDIDQQDTLMKYLYKGMGARGLADANGSVLLSWHEKVR